MAASSNRRLFSTDSGKVHEPVQVEEAETVQVPPPPTEQVFCVDKGDTYIYSFIQLCYMYKASVNINFSFG